MEQPDTSGGRTTGQPAGIIGRVRNSASAQLSQQKDRATDGLGSVAQAVRQSTQQLREQQHETIAQYIEQAADQLERFSTRLREKNVSELVDDAQRFARQRPAVFVGSAFALGLIGARFLKSSSERRDESPYGFEAPGGRSGYAGARIPATGYDTGSDYGTTSGARPGYGTTGDAGTRFGSTNATPGYGGTERR